MECATPLSTDAGARISPTFRMSRIKDLMRRALGGFWILDGLLQLQPRMFETAMLHTVMEPLVVSQPLWIANTVSWAIRFMTPHVVAWNLVIVAVELLVGSLMVFGRQRAIIRTGLWLSIGWTAVVWLFGEGLGGILTGSATVVSGEPGAVLLYGWMAAMLLLSDRHWQFGTRLNAVRDAPAVFFGLAALQQTAPLFWTPMGLASQFQSTWSLEPAFFQHTMFWAVVLSYDHPVTVNLVLILGLAFVAWRLATRRAGRLAYIVAGVLMFMLWWCGQGMGAIFTGFSTDPNTMPLLGLMMVPGYLTRQAEIETSSSSVRPAGTRSALF